MVDPRLEVTPVGAGIGPECFTGASEVVPRHGGSTVIERMCHSCRRGDPLQPVLGKVGSDGLEERRRFDHGMDGRCDVVPNARLGEFEGSCPAADRRVRFHHDDGPTRPRKGDRGGETVRSGADDHSIGSFIESHVSSVRRVRSVGHAVQVSIIVNPWSRADEWMAEFGRIMPDESFELWPDCADPEAVEFVVAGRMKRADLATFTGLRAILSLGAGVEQWQKVGIPDVEVVRLVDPAMSDEMASYALHWVIRFQRQLEVITTAYILPASMQFIRC